MTPTLEFTNTTPFVPFQFESIDTRLNHFGTAVLRGTFRIEHGRRMRFAEEQETLALVDEFFVDEFSDDSTYAALRQPSSLAPYKPKTDLLVEATSYAPSGKPQPSWTAGVQAGPIDKRFTVTGPRRWERRLGVARLSEIEPIASLDVRYEHAYGGSAADGRICRENPRGVGLPGDPAERETPCPQLLPEGNDPPTFRRELPVQALGPVAPNWAPRIDRCGTLDETWQRTVAPYLPADFDFAFYNVAPPGLTFPGFARGDEVIRLHHLTRDGELTFGLPDIQLILLIHLDDGRVIPGPVQLDTIQLFVEEEKAYLEWRGIYPLELPVRHIETRFTAPDYLVESE